MRTITLNITIKFSAYPQCYSLPERIETAQFGSKRTETSRNGPSKILKRTSKITELDQEGLIHTV